MDLLNTIRERKTKKTHRKPANAIVVWWLGIVPRLSFFLAGLLGVLLCLGLFFGFRSCYYKRNPHFMVAPQAINIMGNATITRAYILECFGMNQPRNGYELVTSDIVERLQTQMPLVKNVQMTYVQGDRVDLWVEERMPLARIAGDNRPPLFVDEEGVIFTFARSSGNYPEIGGFDLPEEMMPGNRLPEQLHCMLRLLLTVSNTAEYFNSAVKRVMLLGLDPDDGLVVTLVDGRKITIAWENMSTETETSEAMLQRIRNVSIALKSNVARGLKHFNAMAADRVTMSE